MKSKKLFYYGLAVACLLGNSMAMNETHDLPENAILRHESLRDIKAASELALAESRELHMFLGANPSEHHVAQLRAEEEKREIEEGIKAPIRLYFVNACGLYGIQTSSAKTPILHADFNKEESWNTILEALMIKGGSFNGVFDKIYFDVSTVKAARWGEEILAKIAILLKKFGELYIPDAKLASQSLFCDSYVDQQSYHKLTKIEKKDLPYPANYQTVDKCFLSSGGITTAEERGGAYYAYNPLNLVYDTTFQYSEIIGCPLKFEVFEGDETYPNIGMSYRPEPKEITEQYLRINSFIKITLEGTKNRKAEEISFPLSVISETKGDLLDKLTTTIATQTFIEEEKKMVFKAPTIDEIREQAQKLMPNATKTFEKPNASPFTTLTIGELILKPVIYPHDNSNDFIFRALSLKSHHATYLAKTEGQLNRLVFGYSREGGQGVELMVDFDSMSIDPRQVQHSTDNWVKKYDSITYYPDVEFTVHQ